MSIREGENRRPGGPWPERVTLEGKRVRTAFRVRYAETDQMGMAYYANYLVWFEALRGDLMRAAGIPYPALEAAGYFLPIVDAHVRYLSPARYDEAVEILGWIRELRSRRVSFGYRVERDGQVLAEGSTVHVPMGKDGRPRAFSRELLEALGNWTLVE